MKKPFNPILFALAGFASTSAILADTAQPAYPTLADVTINSNNINTFYQRIDQANNIARNRNVVFIRFTTEEPIRLTRPIRLTQANTRYVFWKEEGTPKAILNGQLRTPFIADANHRVGSTPTYAETPNLDVDVYNINFINFRNSIDRRDAAGVQSYPAGAAIHLSRSNVRVIDSDFRNNALTVPNSRRGMQSISERAGGGAIRIRGGSLLIWDSSFTDNRALTGGAVHVTNSRLEIYGSLFRRNRARGGIDGPFSGSLNWNSEGGAVRIDRSPAPVIVRNCNFLANQAQSFIDVPVPQSVVNFNNGRFPGVNQSASAFNIFNSIDLDNRPILDMSGGSFRNNRLGHIATLRVLDNRNFSQIRNVRFARNGSSDNFDPQTDTNTRTLSLINVSNDLRSSNLTFINNDANRNIR